MVVVHTTENIGVSSILHTSEYQIYREELDIANDISHNPCNQNIDMFCNGLEVNEYVLHLCLSNGQSMQGARGFLSESILS